MRWTDPRGPAHAPLKAELASGLQKVTRHLPFELGEIARDRRDVEASQNRFLRLAVEQKPECRFQTALRRMLARGQAFAHLLRHRDVVMCLTVSFADDHLKAGRRGFRGASDVDHAGLLAPLLEAFT